MSKHYTPTNAVLKMKVINQSEIWSRRAKIYDNLEWVRKKKFLDFFIEQCNPQEDFIALDIGSGTGIVTRELAKRVKKVIGIDLSKDMIIEAIKKDNCENLNVKPIYVQMDAQEMGFLDCTFDLITARMVFHHIENVKKGLKEVYRVLKRGGKFVLCEGVPPDYKVRKRYEEIFALKEKRHTFSEAELINLFYWMGFKNITLKPFFMEQVSLVNWLKNSAVESEVAERILELHLNADEYFKKVYRMTVSDEDIFIDWKFVVVIGEKK
ncbi:hypothetical protein DRO38_05495 [Candidatus Bathyarchaeota archaeon]|nr:MAG: hypothetical protein DRO38_05495 [Candidatus Bathyarchaeota archaeon]